MRLGQLLSIVIPAGSYAGTGTLQVNDNTPEPMHAAVDVTGSEVASTYVIDGETKQWSFSLHYDGAGTFDVLVGGLLSGHGTCDGSSCRYSTTADSLTESFTPTPQGMHISGSKAVGDVHITWSEDLTKQ